MYCPRLDHFVRFNPDGTVSRCGHMVSPPKFADLVALESSQWLDQIKKDFQDGTWPKECERCKDSESTGQTSIREFSIERHKTETVSDYLQVGGVLDNICNSACQFCNQFLSTKIGSLYNAKTYHIVDNSESFYNLPQDRIVMLDINGGEPSASKNYKNLLENLPPNLKKLRINTNGSLIIPGLDKIAEAGVEVTITMSFDGIGPVHDYLRWPIRWTTFEKNLMVYKDTPGINLDLWTTVNAFNINSLDQLIDYAKQCSVDHAYAMLSAPKQLDIKYKNPLTTLAKIKYSNCDNKALIDISELIATKEDNTFELTNFIKHNDQLRQIQIQDYLGDIIPTQ